MLSAGLNLVMTVIGFAVSVMFIVFVCTRLICARIQLRASRRSFQTASRSDLNIMERGLYGLEPVLLSSFPTKKFRDHFPTGRDIQCTVCLSEYQEKDLLRILPICGHVFHVFCIDTWLKQHSTCPMCRISLRGSLNGKRITRHENSALTRSPDVQGNPGLDSHFHPNSDLGVTPRAGDDTHRMDQMHSEPSVAEESVSTLPQVVKASSKIELEGKCISSPSRS